MADGLRVLVTGGRDYGEVPLGMSDGERHRAEAKAAGERKALRGTLNAFLAREGMATLIHGAQRGADSEAGYWARRIGIEVRPFEADWDAHGRAAGPIRNARMIAEGQPDVLIAFPGGKGTADMIRRAKAAGIRVIEVPRETEETNG